MLLAKALWLGAMCIVAEATVAQTPERVQLDRDGKLGERRAALKLPDSHRWWWD